MNIENSQKILEERYKVEVKIEKDQMFFGYNVILSYTGYALDIPVRKEARFYELDLDKLDEWIEENDKHIREKLSIL